MNPWLITWEQSRKNIRNPIAAILHNTTSVREVCQMMAFLHANHVALGNDRLYLSEQVKFAQRKYRCNLRVGQFNRIFSQESPLLFARHVYNLRSSVKGDGYEILTWEEGIYPEVKQDTTDLEIARHFNRKKRRPRTRVQMVFDTETMRITMGDELVDP
jgi:hypothetical protein